jgi:ClpP class serine protease
VDPLSLLWLFFILASLQPAAQRYVLEARRRANLEALAKKRGSTMITLIHRQESMSLFGFPLVRYIDIDDAGEHPPGYSQDTTGASRSS